MPTLRRVRNMYRRVHNLAMFCSNKTKLQTSAPQARQQSGNELAALALQGAGL